MGATDNLFDAIAAGDLEALASQLDAGADPNPFDAEQQTPLMRAATAGHRPMVEALLAAGGDPILTDGLGETAMIKAAGSGHAHLIRLLNAKSSDDEQALAATLLRHAGQKLPPGPPTEVPDQKWTRRFAAAGAYVAQKLGNRDPQQRLDRLERAEKKSR